MAAYVTSRRGSAAASEPRSPSGRGPAPSLRPSWIAEYAYNSATDERTCIHPARLTMNAHPPSQRTILVVEDDLDLAKLIQFCLAREGFEVRHAADGEQALQEFDLAPRPDLVIMD